MLIMGHMICLETFKLNGARMNFAIKLYPSLFDFLLDELLHSQFRWNSTSTLVMVLLILRCRKSFSCFCYGTSTFSIDKYFTRTLEGTSTHFVDRALDNQVIYF